MDISPRVTAPLLSPLHRWANIVNWINERTNREQVVSDAEEMDVFLDENPLAIVGLFISERDSDMYYRGSDWCGVR